MNFRRLFEGVDVDDVDEGDFFDWEEDDEDDELGAAVNWAAMAR